MVDQKNPQPTLGQTRNLRAIKSIIFVTWMSGGTTCVGKSTLPRIAFKNDCFNAVIDISLKVKYAEGAMKKNKSLIFSLISILVTFAFIEPAAGETHSYQIYLPVVIAPIINHPPLAANDAYSTSENTQRAVSAPGVLANDSDLDGDALTALWVSDPIHGNLSFNQDGSFTYLPDSGFTGSDSFTYKVSDGALESKIATVNLTINSIGPSCSSAPTQISPSNGDNAN